MGGLQPGLGWSISLVWSAGKLPFFRLCFNSSWHTQVVIGGFTNPADVEISGHDAPPYYRHHVLVISSCGLAKALQSASLVFYKVEGLGSPARGQEASTTTPTETVPASIQQNGLIHLFCISRLRGLHHCLSCGAWS